MTGSIENGSIFLESATAFTLSLQRPLRGDRYNEGLDGRNDRYRQQLQSRAPLSLLSLSSRLWGK